MIRRVNECERIPSWHRIAYYDVMRRQSVCLPIGLHLIARAIRRIWEWSHAYRPSRLEKMLIEAKRKGQREGEKWWERRDVHNDSLDAMRYAMAGIPRKKP